MAQIKEIFVEYIEELDVGHGAKNICKKVKELGREHKALIGFGEKVKRRFQDLAYKSKRDVKGFKKGWNTAIQHWCGNHTQCIHGEKVG